MKTPIKKLASALLALGILATTGGAASAVIDPACAITPLAPYKSGTTFIYGGTINCSQAKATRIESTGQRQGTASWVAIGSSVKSSQATKFLSDSGAGSLITSTSTYRSSVKGFSANGGSSIVNSKGSSITK